jgi:diphosphomevalonate decarboxylase
MEKLKSFWRSPSNIAIVKYWGKKPLQIPANPSISFTLDKVYTETSVELIETKNKKKDLPEIEFLFEGKPKPEFLAKITNLVKLALESKEFEGLKDFKLIIQSQNNFPYGTGIASSASSMSALALCLCELNAKIEGKTLSEDTFLSIASFWSRMGSGSACRSVFGGFVEWGKHAEITGSNDLFAIPLQNIHTDFQTICDSVLIIDSGEKQVSSSKGHDLLNKHWYASKRYEEGFQNTSLLYNALQEGNLEEFGILAEKEALSLHAMMLTSNPGYFLIKPNTLFVLEKIRQFRFETGLPIYFTMDAGPNVHLLYFEKDASIVKNWIQNELSQYCFENSVFHNKLGKGAENLAISSL